jgi:hypothetical protein
VGAALAASDISYSMFQTIDVNNSPHMMPAVALCPSNPRKSPWHGRLSGPNVN